MRNEFSLPLTFACPAGAAANLVVVAHSLQCAGMAALIAWANTSLVPPPDIHGLGPLRSAVLMLQSITAFIVLHCFEILFWAGSYRSIFIVRSPPLTSRPAPMPPWAMTDIVLPRCLVWAVEKGDFDGGGGFTKATRRASLEHKIS